MSRLNKLYVTLTTVLLICPGIIAVCFGQVENDSASAGSVKIYAIQVAASKVFIDPVFFEQKFNLTDKVSYFRKDGWYKYVTGSYSTETEAVSALSGLKFEAFVTALTDTRLPDSSLIIQADSAKPLIPEAKLRLLYNQKIKEADSAFNISKNLLLARQLYLDASLIGPDKNYPKDQVVEIDKQLIQSHSKSFFSQFTLTAYLIAGFTSLLFFFVIIVLIIKFIRKGKSGLNHGRDKEVKESALGFLYEEVLKKRQDLIGQIRDLYPCLNRELSDITGESAADQVIVHSQIERCLNSDNEILRMEAELALLLLDEDDPFAFLDKLEQEFTSWEQLHVFEMASRNHLPFPDFSRWMNSPNDSVVLFCKRMMGAKGPDVLPSSGEPGLQAVAGQILLRSIERHTSLILDGPAP